jgi:hypothetical protein
LKLKTREIEQAKACGYIKMEKSLLFLLKADC